MLLFLLPVIAVLIGVVLTFALEKSNAGYINILLSFSGAFLLALTLFDLLPEVYDHLDAHITGLFIMCGILLQIILEYFSKGAEHGHVHIHAHASSFPWLLFSSLCLHSFLEGFPIHSHNDMVYGVLVHKIPIAALITAFLIQSKYSHIQIASFLVFFIIMTPLGTFISNDAEISENALTMINALVIGIFFHISTTILFESSEGHKFNLSKLLAIIMGVAIAYLI